MRAYRAAFFRDVEPTFKAVKPVPNAIRAEVFAYKGEGEALVTVPDTPEARDVFQAIVPRGVHPGPD